MSNYKQSYFPYSTVITATKSISYAVISPDKQTMYYCTVREVDLLGV